MRKKRRATLQSEGERLRAYRGHQVKLRRSIFLAQERGETGLVLSPGKTHSIERLAVQHRPILLGSLQNSAEAVSDGLARRQEALVRIEQQYISSRVLGRWAACARADQQECTEKHYRSAPTARGFRCETAPAQNEHHDAPENCVSGYDLVLARRPP